MKCPSCSTELKMADRSGVEIDYCPQCRGVWLDRGELDKIIERSMSATPAVAAPPPPMPGLPPRRDDDRYDDDYRRYHDHRRYDDDNYKKRRKKSFLGELFDFD